MNSVGAGSASLSGLARTPGLRERKKVRTRASIQKEAMRLFLERGFEETTIEEIAEAVEISPSTFFNYFPSKEAVVFQDDLDPLILQAFDAQPSTVNPIRRLRNAMRAVFENLTPDQERLVRERTQLFLRTPELRGAMFSQFADLVNQVAELLATRAGKNTTDFAVRNMAGAVLGVLLAAMLTVSEDPKADMVKLADGALAHLEAGLPLDWKQ
ncbi:MAG TPA: TetR family transcriptional regulator [Candidatus Dormibacteraeota bacterium]|nr:TetR family transcriptional regulator [Candidatus Dormibacteraeota bacterium]